MRTLLGSASLIWLVSAVTLSGQEVRRALPPGSPSPTKDDVLRAQPVGSPASRANVSPQSILGQRLPSGESRRASKSSGSAAEPDKTPKESGAGEIRLAPNSTSHAGDDPAKSQLALADGFYARKLYDLAAAEYERFIDEYPENESYPGAMFRLGDSYARSGKDTAALTAYRTLIARADTGEYVGSAAFRLASRYFDSKDYGSASGFYQKAYENAKSPEIKLTARYYQAKCLELANRKTEAKSVYEDVSATKENNPFRDAARLSVGYLALESGKKAEAFDSFTSLAADATKPAVKSEALTRAGVLAEDQKKKDQAEQFFRNAISLSAEGKWKQIAQLELMKLEYDGDRFAQVLDAYSKNINALGDETKPSVLLIVANSYRQLGKNQKAIEIYTQILKQFASSPEANDARFQRLVALDQVKDPSLVKEADLYLATNPPKERIDKAKLLKAQGLIQLNQFALAAKIYVELANSSLPSQYKADCYYAAGYSLSQIKQTQRAIDAFTGLIDNYPDYPMAAKAIFKRALLHQDLKEYGLALTDFSRIVSDYRSAPEREPALLQKGLTLGQQEDYAAMTSTFRQLLQEFPQSSGAAQANYWIGWGAFQQKKFSEALPFLLAARKLDEPAYGEKTTLRLILSYQALNQAENAANEVRGFLQKHPQQESAVADSCRWLGIEYFDQRRYQNAAEFLEVYARTTERDRVDRALWLALGRSEIEIKKYPEATQSAQNYLAVATEQIERARGLVVLGEAQLGSQNFDAAAKSAEEAMTLQPEGRVNADARLALGDIELARNHYENAARSYLSVAVLYEDADVTPHALAKAYKAFQQAGNASQANKTLTELRTRFPNYQIQG